PILESLELPVNRAPRNGWALAPPPVARDDGVAVEPLSRDALRVLLLVRPLAPRARRAQQRPSPYPPRRGSGQVRPAPLGQPALAWRALICRSPRSRLEARWEPSRRILKRLRCGATRAPRQRTCAHYLSQRFHRVVGDERRRRQLAQRVAHRERREPRCDLHVGQKRRALFFERI